MRFYVGLHKPRHARRFPRCCISVNRLRTRTRLDVGEWILDSGAFTEISTHGCFRDPPEVYASHIANCRQFGQLQWAATQDWMCEPWILERTGLSVSDHQRLTIERYDALRALAGPIVLPVLQGYTVDEYVAHVRAYGARLERDAMVGVGSVCKRQGRSTAIAGILEAVLRERPDLRLHGFGVGLRSLADGQVRDLLHSADSMAWSFAARMQGRNGNCWREARAYAVQVETMPVQAGLFG